MDTKLPLTPKLLLIAVLIVSATIAVFALNSLSTPTSPVFPSQTSPPNTVTPSIPSSPASPPASTPPTTSPTIAVFNFDGGSPPLSQFQSTPFNQTSNGVTSHFSSPLEPHAFSIQNHDTTFFKLTQLTGNYLYLTGTYRSQLEIEFSQPIKSITFSFATIEYHGGPTGEPSIIKLTAYMDSASTNAIGSATAMGNWPSETSSPGDSYPQGTLTFTSSGQSFNLVRIELPIQGTKSASAFLVDNVTVETA